MNASISLLQRWLTGLTGRARLIIGVFLLAMLPRLLVTLAFIDLPIGLDDMLQYDMLARSLASGHGYSWYQRADVRRMQTYMEKFYGLDIDLNQVPEEGLSTTFRAPGYPFFLAGIYALTDYDSRLVAARLVQVLLGSGLACLTALLALRLGASSRAALLAGIAVAFYPMFWLYPLALASENIFLPLVVWGILALLMAAEARSPQRALAAGLILGAATLTRGALILFLPWAGLWLWRRVGRLPTLTMIFGWVLVVAPWSLRNSLALGRPAFVETTMGYNLFIGYHPDGDGGFLTDVAVLPLQIIDDGQRDRWTTQQAFGFIRQDPTRFLTLILRRLAYFWGLEGREVIYFYSNALLGPIPVPIVTVGLGILMAPLISLGVAAPVGFVLSRGSARWLLFGLIGATMLAYVPVLADARYHMPLVPFLAVLAGVAWDNPRSWRRFGTGLHRKELAWLFALLAILLLIVLWGWDLGIKWPRLAAILKPGGHLTRFNY